MGHCLRTVFPQEQLVGCSFEDFTESWHSAEQSRSFTWSPRRAGNPLAGNRLRYSVPSLDFKYINGLRVPLTKMTSQLYIGSFWDAKNEKDLRESGITHIISVIDPIHIIEGMRHGHNPMNVDGQTELKQVMDELWPIIAESQKPDKALFIHCACGQNRSATVLLAIMMQQWGKKLNEAWELLKTKRPSVEIHERYAKQLLKIELELFGSNSLPDNWMEAPRYNMKSRRMEYAGGSCHQLQ